MEESQADHVVAAVDHATPPHPSGVKTQTLDLKALFRLFFSSAPSGP